MSRTYRAKDNRWWGHEPKWWRSMMKHRKRRASVRKACTQVMQGDQDASFPLDKKPWIYYW